MMVDIFSSFDDHNSTIFSAHFMTWIMSLWSLFFINSSYWINPSNLTSILSLPKQTINIQTTRSYSMNLGGFSLLVSSLFITIINFNMLGLMPYVFSTTSHLAMTFSLALPLWLSLILSSYAQNPYSSLAFMLPLGTPSFLIPFLPIIESLSILVRPITLSIRLAANISAGHIILTLIGDYLTITMLSGSFVVLTLVMLVQVGYFIFEIGIGIIQGYIFSLLITLYTDDHQ
uniref:ATP synthase subunit a n=1 Tax=Watasenia scintillans TaxID=6625 RepID=Q60I47_WATSC|nr:ATP synthase F0 subunit 6 [Watasenia scintillans]AIL50379.1 ATP synthetase subunit 6 [Watasenia scintillans]AIL50391.1 ATP synthetase subunit 6 [Watasenia scintillans]BAD52098.1 ATP synthetase subunit 6 [Watasenia scintillans]BAE80015.1 ATP synthetase subunit 6 [Watasenia scintillans]